MQNGDLENGSGNINLDTTIGTFIFQQLISMNYNLLHNTIYLMFLTLFRITEIEIAFLQKKGLNFFNKELQIIFTITKKTT